MNICFIIIGILKMLDLNLNRMFVINAMTAYEIENMAM